MPEQFDVFSDGFWVTVSPWGATLSFQLSEAPSPRDEASLPARLGTIRLTTEHLMALAFIVRRQIKVDEENRGTRYDLPEDVLKLLEITREDWEVFWGRGGD